MKYRFTRRRFLEAAGVALSLVVVCLPLSTCLAVLAVPPAMNSRSSHPAPRITERVELIRLQNLSVELTGEPASFVIDVKNFRQRLVSAARSSTDKLLLELDDAEAERPPGAVWEVYVGLPPTATPDTGSVYYVGNLSLYGAGIRSEAKQGFKPARFVFSINRAVQAALKSGRDGSLSVTFVPHGVLVDGKPSRPTVQSPVHIHRAALSLSRD